MKDIMEVWGGFEEEELDLMLFCFGVTQQKLRERARQDKRLHDTYDAGSPGDMAHYEYTGMTQREALRQEILTKQRMFCKIDALAEQACYVANIPFHEGVWSLG